MSKSFALQQWLRQHGPATRNQIYAAGFTNFQGLTCKRMLDFGAIKLLEIPNNESGRKFARLMVVAFVATDKDYLPIRGRKRKEETYEQRQQVAIRRAISCLEQRGYTVTAPKVGA